MSMLVTGASGFLGGAVVRAARATGLAPIATSRRADLPNRCDIADPSALERLLDRIRPDVIVNCAACVDFSEQVLAQLYPVNVLAPGILAAWASRRGAHLVHVSSVVLHGVRAARVDASTPPAPDTDYGRSKYLAEQLVRASGAAATIVRIGGIFGIEGPGHLGINVALRSCRDGKRPLLRGQGGRRNYIHVDDAAAALVECVVAGRTGTFVLAGAESLTMADMLQCACDEYLPGESPEFVAGGTIPDAIVSRSPELLSSRGFREAVRAERAAHSGGSDGHL
jgi:dTDP-4-dehydrorhamnose reductase